MSSSLGIIETVEPRIPEGFLTSRALSNVRALATRLPDVLSAYYLECRLSEEDEQVDFLACLSASPHTEHMQGISDVARRRRGTRKSPGGAVRALGPAWPLAWDLIHRWADPERGWYGKLPFLWLEVDQVHLRPPEASAPSVCVCVDPGYPDDSLPGAWDPGASLESCLDFVVPALPPAFASLLSAETRRTMAACFNRLPAGGRIIHVSFMLAREPMTLKLYGAVPRDRLLSYLSDIGWPGPRAALQRVLDTFCDATTAGETVYFDLALDGGVLPYVATAFSQLQLDGPTSDDPGRTALLGLLAREGLCAPHKRAGAAAWPGSHRDKGAKVRVHRWLDVKITLHPERGAGAKGYLGFAPVSSVF